jgi:hypothetical protein
MAALGYRSPSIRSIHFLQPMFHVVIISSFNSLSPADVSCCDHQLLQFTANDACRFLIPPFCIDSVDAGVLCGMFALFCGLLALCLSDACLITHMGSQNGGEVAVVSA